MDLRWNWDHATDKIWRQLDPVLWELTQNPLVILQTVSHERTRQVLENSLLQDLIQELSALQQQHALAPAWYQHQHPGSKLSSIAYFSMEYMLSEALPIYSGGLGNVAGDHLKTASDLGVPVCGVGLLYQQGYSRQVINKDGTQQYVVPFNDPGQLPISPLRDEKGEWLRIEVKLPGYSVWLRTWRAQVGRVNLYLLDSNDAANFPLYRGITSELYGGDATTRFLQELVLGMGGWRLLKRLGIRPQVCHLNEGHAAFVVVERALDLMEAAHLSFAEALATTRSGNVFTTHTSIGAGFDLFDPGLITQYLGAYIRNRLQLSYKDFLALGRKDKDNDREPFNTSFLAMRGSAFVNGVSRLHQQVSQKVFADLFPRYPLDEVPVDSVTNGVHMSTWDSPESDKLWTETCGKERWLGTLTDLSKQMLAVPLETIWHMRQKGKETFVQYIQERYALQLATLGSTVAEMENAKTVLDGEALTIGFARRFISYKRPSLLLQDRGRLRTLLLNTERPVQLVLAGKAHRRDEAAQALIREWVQFIQTEGLQHKIVFLSDYDMHLCEHMVQGVDVWINTPKRPWEACGTSGMKILVNGGLNLSVLDGWWDEAYEPGLGWAIGNRDLQQEDASRDEEDASQLYHLLEVEILPLFYTRNQEGIPEGWVSRVRESMARLTPQYSSNRSLREYVERFYLPASALYNERVAQDGEKGKKIAASLQSIRNQWDALQFSDLSIYTREGMHFFEAKINLAAIAENEITVELYADAMNGYRAEKHRMVCKGKEDADAHPVLFTLSVPAHRPASDYTVRIVPFLKDARIPLELNCIRWHH